MIDSTKMGNNVKRTFIPGDRWVYFKIYTGYKTSDILLSKVLPQVINQLKAEHSVEKWFFLRYSDPYYHLRIRFYVNDSQGILHVISTINEAIAQYVNDDLIWKVQIDTYQRELERYGTKTIEDSENIFYFDSEAITQILEKLAKNENNQQRWLLALKKVDSLLDDFCYNIEMKHEFLISVSNNFKMEFGFNNQGYKSQLDNIFRENRKVIEEILTNTEKIDWFLPFSEIIKQKSQKVIPVAKTLISLEEKRDLEVPLNNLLGSHTHMMINRLFRSKQRLTEMVIYDMLQRYYSSAKARMKYNLNGAKKEQKEVIQEHIIV